MTWGPLTTPSNCVFLWERSDTGHPTAVIILQANWLQSTWMYSVHAYFWILLLLPSWQAPSLYSPNKIISVPVSSCIWNGLLPSSSLVLPSNRSIAINVPFQRTAAATSFQQSTQPEFTPEANVQESDPAENAKSGERNLQSERVRWRSRDWEPEMTVNPVREWDDSVNPVIKWDDFLNPVKSEMTL